MATKPHLTLPNDIQVFGTWSDVHDYQFMVDWYEAGTKCLVILLSGSDYGGGITGYAEIPYKEVEDLLDKDLPEMDLKLEVIDLVEKYGEKK